MPCRLVTGFVPDAFPAKHLSQDEFRRLGDQLADAAGDRLVQFETPWDECWAANIVRHYPDIRPSCRNPPADRFATPLDMVRSNVVLLQRYEWMHEASIRDADTFAWVEWSVMKQRGVTADVIRRFIDDLDRHPCTGLALPGCWPMSPIDDGEAHWRFVGSVWVCSRHWLQRTFAAVESVASLRAHITRTLSWDMNTMAYVELLGVLPIRWYEANHDETQFTHYARGL